MKKAEVEIGGTYVKKVSGALVRVKIDSVSEYGGWNATNLHTNRSVRVKSAAGLRKALGTKALLRPKVDYDKPPEVTPSLEAPRKAEEASESNPPNPPTLVLEPVAEKPMGLAEGVTEAPKPGLSSLMGVKPCTDTSPHLIVRARAGTGKTTTLVEGLKRVKGIPSSLVPSPQQSAVWDSMSLSAGKVQSIAFVAFNKSIATELQQRMPAGCESMTLHSLGLKAVTKAFGRVKVESYRVQDIISEITERDIRELRFKKPTLLKATEDLVALCKQNLTNEQDANGCGDHWESELEKLASHYDVELNGCRSEVFDLVPKVLERCKDVARDGQIDFNDMIWLPVALGLPVFKYDLLLVDEAQDLNRCQQQLAIKAGRRLILCGDDRQAIYGFAGADAESLPRLQGILEATERKCQMLPLTVTRRCGKAIVELAKGLVPDFEAFESNGDGKVGKASYTEPKEPVKGPDGADDCSYRGQVRDGDFILCRCNAPLVSQCFRFLKEGRKANIQGRDIGQGLISTIKKLKAETVVDLVSRISDWHFKEVGKVQATRNPSEAKLIALDDRRDCLMAFTEDAKTVEEVLEKINRVFTDDSKGGIRLSSGHRAKGLEAKRVFLLQVKGATCPHPMAKSPWQRQQEHNLLYVMYTRAIEELVIVS